MNRRDSARGTPHGQPSAARWGCSWWWTAMRTPPSGSTSRRVSTHRLVVLVEGADVAAGHGGVQQHQAEARKVVDGDPVDHVEAEERSGVTRGQVPAGADVVVARDHVDRDRRTVLGEAGERPPLVGPAVLGDVALDDDPLGAPLRRASSTAPAVQRSGQGVSWSASSVIVPK